ncbi:hypothetical protein HQ560_19980 [bacterium]|nr:hypothetical protein [bacterium]
MSDICPSCHSSVSPNTVICLACGHNLKTGETLHTATTAEPDDAVEEESPPTGKERFLMILGEWAPGLFRAKVVVAAALVALLGLAVMVFGAVLFAMGSVLAPMLVATGGAIVYTQGVVWIFDGEICLLNEALTNMDGKRLFALALCLAAPVLVLFAAMDYISQYWSDMGKLF